MRLPYPSALGIWPAFVLLLAFAWIELDLSEPGRAAAYRVARRRLFHLTFTGMFVFGRERWLRHGEVFSLVFGTFARFAPIELRPGRNASCGCGRSAPGSSTASPVSTSMIAFVLLLLSTVLFDGALGTPEWGKLESALAAHLSAGRAQVLGGPNGGIARVLAVFFGAYLGVARS